MKVAFQKIIFGLLFIASQNLAMEKSPKSEKHSNDSAKILENSFIGMIPPALVRSVVPFFGTPGPQQRALNESGEVRARDNREDCIVEASKNMRQFAEYYKELFGSSLESDKDAQQKFLEAELAFLKSNDKKSYFSANIFNVTAAMDPGIARSRLSEEIKQKIELFGQLPQSEKNKVAVDCMKRFPSPQILEQLLDAGVDVNAQEPQTKFTLLRYCVEAQLTEGAQLLLEKKASPDLLDCQKISPLMRAASIGDTKLMALLLFYKSTVNVLDANGRSALSYAARKGDAKGVSILLLNGAHLFAAGESGKQNALVEAVESGMPEVLKKLLDTCNPHQSQLGTLEVFVNLALKKAAKKGDYAMVEELLPSRNCEGRNPKPDMLLDPAKPHETTISCAIEGGHTRVALRLLEYARDRYYKGFAKIEYSRSYALAIAVRNKIEKKGDSAEYQEIIDALLEENADPIESTKCPSAAFLAANNADEALLKQLIDAAALKRYSQKNKYHSMIDHATLRKHKLHYTGKILWQAAQVGACQAINTLYHYGAHLDVIDKTGNTILHKIVIIADENALKMIDELCQKCGIDVNKKNSKGDTSLHCVMKNPSAQMRERLAWVLLKNGADPNATNNEGDTPLIVAAKMEPPQIGVIDALLIRGDTKKANPDIQNLKGETALISAVSKGHSHIDVVEKILNAGANPDLKNNSGCGALTKAAKYGLDDMTRLLEERGASLDEFKDGMLREAAKYGHAAYIKQLLPKKPAINGHSSSRGDTPLHKAIRRKHVEVVKLLLENGADPKTQNFKGTTPMELATEIGDKKIIDILLFE